jgi:hypothetical protein
MKTILKSLLLAATALVSGQAFAVYNANANMNPPVPITDQSVHITDLNFNGTGCRNGGSDATGRLYDTNNDGLPDQFEVLFSTYIAEQGPDVSPAQRRKNCNMTVQLFLPQGFQFSIANVLYLGFADLPGGVSGTQRSEYEFINLSNRVRLQTLINGPYTDNYRREDVLGVASRVWSPCGTNAPLSIRSEVFLTGPRSLPASMTLDQVTGKVTQIYGLTWKRCD